MALLLTVWTGQPAEAQDPGDMLKQEMVGGLRLIVLSRPKEPIQGTGGPRFSVVVARAADRSPVDDAQVVVSMDRPDGSSAGDIVLEHNPALPGVYESRISVRESGTWEWRVAVSTAASTEFLEGTLTVQPAPSGGLRSTIAWFGLLFALGVIVFLAWRSLRPKKPQASPSG